MYVCLCRDRIEIGQGRTCVGRGGIQRYYHTQGRVCRAEYIRTEMARVRTRRVLSGTVVLSAWQAGRVQARQL
jgi:hypothetical protein